MENTIIDRLFAFQDEKYRLFQSKLMPTVPFEKIIGVRTPDARKMAKELAATEEAEAFMKGLPHRYYEEDNLHAFLIEGIRDFDACVQALDVFLPHVDNWATCDSMSPAIFKKQPERLLPHIRRWMNSEHVYTIRFGIGMLMRHFLKAHFSPEYPEMVAAVRSEEYYVNMMIAWYFATALAFQYESIIPYLEKRVLSPWIHSKTIQKAIESYRITDAQKAYLRTLKH